MKTLRAAMIAGLLLALPSVASTHCKKCEGKDTCPLKKSEKSPATSFDSMKSLTGSWKATQVKDGKKETVRVTYKVTSGGSAVEETLFPGTPREMVSLYTVNQGKLQMTHYCMLGNQPRLQETKSQDGEIALNFVDGGNVNPRKDKYMGSATIRIKDAKHLEQKWVAFDAKKPFHTEEFSFTREK